MKKVDFRGPYTRKKVSFKFTEPSLTEQSYKDECDIDYIIKNFVRTGELPESTMSYIDCTTVPEYQNAQYIIAEVNSNFAKLSSADRDRFKTVENYLAFISSPENLKESYEKGYIDRSTVDINDVYPVVNPDSSFIQEPVSSTQSVPPEQSNLEAATPQKTE